MSESKTNNNNEPDPREALLPWYVTGKLGEKDRAAAESYLEEHPEMRLQLELAGEELEAAIVTGDAVDAPSARMLDRLMSEIETAEGPERTRQGLMSRMVETLTGFMPSAAPMGLRVAGIAAALIICVQAGTIGWYALQDRAPAGYQTASGESQPLAQGPAALIAFQDDAAASDIAAALNEAGATIVEGPRDGGVFVIRFKSASMSEEDAAAAIAALAERQDLVKFAARTR